MIEIAYPTFTDGQVQVRGKVSVRGKRKRADYLLYFQPNLPLAVIEAKDGTFEVGSGMSQALGYADVLDVPFVFSSNRTGFLFHDLAFYFVRVKWDHTVPLNKAVKEVGFFGNQNTVCRPSDPKWDHTVERPKQVWGVK